MDAERRYSTKGSDTRTKIMMSARNLFAEKGFWGTSVKDITDAASVNKAMLFYYFQSKENLYYTLLEEILEDILQWLKTRLDEQSHPNDKLRVVMDIFDKLCNQPKNFYMFKIMFQDIMGPESVRESLEGYMKSIQDLIAAVVEEGVSAGIFRQVDPGLTALSIIGILYMFARHRLLMGDDFTQENVSSYIYSMVLEGIQR